MPKKSVFTRLLGVFRNFIMRGRCLAPKARALPTALHPDNIQIYFNLLNRCFVRPVKSHSRLASLGTLASKAPCLVDFASQKRLLIFFSSLTQSTALRATLHPDNIQIYFNLLNRCFVRPVKSHSRLLRVIL